MEKNETKRVSVVKIIVISAFVAIAAFTIIAALYKFFKKYFKISFDCGDCDSCDMDCFGSDFDAIDLDDDDYFEPECTLCDEADENDIAAEA